MITIQNLKKVFQLETHSVTAVESLNQTINQGDIFGVIGYSGAGKSTFVRLLNRLEEPTSGNVHIDGKEMSALRGKKLREARQEIGMIFQHFNLLWSRTTEENIAFPLEVAGASREEKERRVNELIEIVGLTGREKSYPSQLSGGQKQRVGIARALANNPSVLLCDEATSALDPDTTNSILDLLMDINQQLGITIVIITHEMHVIRKICNRVAVMEDGRVAEEGNVMDIFTNPQQEVTKKFVDQVVSQSDDKESMDYILNLKSDGKIVRLHFIGDTASEAVISEAAKQFDISVNILQGKLTQTTTGVLGTLTVQLQGNQASVAKAITFMEETEVEVEVIRDED